MNRNRDKPTARKHILVCCEKLENHCCIAMRCSCRHGVGVHHSKSVPANCNSLEHNAVAILKSEIAGKQDTHKHHTQNRPAPLLEPGMTLTHLSGAKSLQDPLLSQFRGEWVALSPVAKARWYEATEVAQLPLIRNKQLEAVCSNMPPSSSPHPNWSRYLWT